METGHRNREAGMRKDYLRHLVYLEENNFHRF
jgi:hypothetical protein